MLLRLRASAAGGLVLVSAAAWATPSFAQAAVGSRAAPATQYVREQHASFVFPRGQEPALAIARASATVVAQKRSGHTARDVLIGAALGGAILGGWAFHTAAHCDACFFEGYFIAAGVGVGALGGGLIGWIVSRLD